jgi:hypothetical protein
VDWLADRHVRKRADRVQPCPMAPTWSAARMFFIRHSISARTDGRRFASQELLSNRSRHPWSRAENEVSES